MDGILQIAALQIVVLQCTSMTLILAKYMNGFEEGYKYEYRYVQVTFQMPKNEVFSSTSTVVLQLYIVSEKTSVLNRIELVYLGNLASSSF